MAKKLYVGNLSYTTNDASLRDAFAQAGTVTEASVIINRQTNQSRGFGFITMETDEESDSAINMWNGKELDGRKIIVNEARPPEARQDRPRREWN